MDINLIQLKVLLSFYDLKNNNNNVLMIDIAKKIGIADYKMSRIVSQFEAQNILKRDKNNKPMLTNVGLKLAEEYSKRINIAKDILISTIGLKQDEIFEDALKMAIYCTDKIFKVAEEQANLKKVLYQHKFMWDKILYTNLDCKKYICQFTIYRKNLKKEKILSMANDGFLHPCTLNLCNGEGVITLKPVPMIKKSKFTGLDMSGQLKSLKYFNGKKFIEANIVDGLVNVPLNYCNFSIIESESAHIILHGSIYLKMACTVGELHMPESIAIFTFEIV